LISKEFEIKPIIDFENFSVSEMGTKVLLFALYSLLALFAYFLTKLNQEEEKSKFFSRLKLFI